MSHMFYIKFSTNNLSNILSKCIHLDRGKKVYFIYYKQKKIKQISISEYFLFVFVKYHQTKTESMKIYYFYPLMFLLQ